MIKKIFGILFLSCSFWASAQTTLNTTITSSQTVEDPILVRMVPGFKVAATPNLTFRALIGNNSGIISSNPLCEQYGKIIISEIHFDTHYNEEIESKYHHFGEYIELYNSSNVPVNLENWVIRDDHTMFKFTQNQFNTNLIIQPGDFKIITYNGFYAHSQSPYEGIQDGAQSAIGGRNKFIELFPELFTNPNFNSSNIILQNTMVLFNVTDKVSLYAPNGTLTDQVAYNNTGNPNEPPVWANTIFVNPYIFNKNGGVFNGAIGLVIEYDVNGNIVYESDGITPHRIQNDNFKKAIYRSVSDSYYSNGSPLDFAVATASPFTMPEVTIPLRDLDPFLFYIQDNSANAIESIVYDLKNQTTIVGQSKTYLDDMGKPTVSLSKDFENNRVWGSETVYDNFGRKWKESFPTTTCMDFDNINFLSNPAIKTAYLEKFYSDNNTLEAYQATAEQPYSEINYDKLNPDNAINIVGGNKIGGDWKTGYSYTVSAAQEMYYAYGYNYYDGNIAAGKEEIITKFYKSVGIDANGVENVSFTDGEGKLLASARSGGAAYPVHSLIGTQGFIDVHIPAGITTAQISLIGGASLYDVFDLKTGDLVTVPLVGGNAYRVVAKTIPVSESKVYVTNVPTGGVLSYDTGAKGISYHVNYYEYAVNIYNKTGQLIKTIQPNGYQANTVIKDAPSHMSSAGFASSFEYNDQGQLKLATSSDEGTSKLLYRQDGQIRYSQSALQADTKVSYTEYDEYARPIESGVVTKASGGIWAIASAGPDAVLIPETVTEIRSERNFTIYDYADESALSALTLIQVLNAALISPTNYVQQNLSGNVAITFSKPGAAINAITWYSYDLYGRVTWVVQYNEGIGAKTIHYEYDYKGNVKKVLYQKDKSTELFVHQYTYDSNNTLKKVQTSTNNSTFITHADYDYYATGELKRLNIAEGAQGLDYVYTLGGQLKSINHPSLEPAKDPGHDLNDVFGITLDYYDGDYSRSGTNITSSPTIAAGSPDLSGNIKAARWANKNDVVSGVASQQAYMYNYNRNNWMTDATYGTTNNSGTITASAMFKEGALSYDANGNIKTLQRTNNAGTVTDNLVYTYPTDKNRLSSVNDTGATTSAIYDDLEGTNNYQYNAIGQLTVNVNENLFYSYNTQGLVTEVKKGSNSIVKFYYNERGQRIRKENFTPGTNTIAAVDYYVLDTTGNTMAVYNKPLGSSIITEKELPIYGSSRLGVYVKSGNPLTDYITYQVTDHLGNVRAVIKKTIGSSVIAIYTSDYYPFGERLPSRDNITGEYRYAFQGQELDKETGMEAFQLRLWDGRLGRWLSPDPAGQYASPYLGMGNSPVNGIDADGGYFYGGPSNEELRGIGIGLWNSVKSMARAVYYVGDTVDGIANLVEVAVATSGVFGGLPGPYGNKFANAYAYDHMFGTNTNTADKYLAMTNGIDNYFKRVTSTNDRERGTAVGEFVGTVLGSKGLGALRVSVSFAPIVAEAGIGGEVLALQATESQLLLGRGAAIPNGNFYSVAFEMNLKSTSYPGVSSYKHFQEANIALASAMKYNSSLGNLGISIPRSAAGSIGGTSPRNWVWHHSIDIGVMQLVPKYQHPNIPGGIFWTTMHPQGRGGMSIWGGRYDK